MLQRHIAAHLHGLLQSNPAVAVLGPRQVGKTTLVKALAPHYFDLELPGERLRLDLQWPQLLASGELVALDEAQAWPEVFPLLRSAIDMDRGRMGRFVLTGSVSPALMRDISESLAGRLALCPMTPLLATELPAAALDDLWLTGGFPDGGVLGGGRFPKWQRDYLDLLCARDLPDWGLPAKPSESLRLLRMLAALHGRAWNASEVGKSLGLSYHTVNRWTDVLAGAFLVRMLPPMLPNLGKRLTRTPKVWLRDSGLVHALLGVRTFDDLLAQPWVGASYEGFVIEQILGALQGVDRLDDAGYFRTSDGHECDLVVHTRGQVWAVEVKLSTSVNPHDLRKLRQVGAMVGATGLLLVSRDPQTVRVGQEVATDLAGALGVLLADGSSDAA